MLIYDNKPRQIKQTCWPDLGECWCIKGLAIQTEVTISRTPHTNETGDPTAPFLDFFLIPNIGNGFPSGSNRVLRAADARWRSFGAVRGPDCHRGRNKTRDRGKQFSLFPIIFRAELFCDIADGKARSYGSVPETPDCIFINAFN